jgi:uncharacterized membrane protein
MHLIATSFYEPDKVTFYNVVLFIHIAAAIIAFGGTFTYGFVQGVVTRPDQRRHVPFWHRLQHQIGNKLITPAAVVILLAGIYLAAVGNYDFGKSFVAIGVVIIVVLLGAAHAFFGPTEERAAEAAERDISAAGSGEVVLGPEYQALAKRLALGGIAGNLLVLVAVFVMVVKPL